jgi:hypothetical protein
METPQKQQLEKLAVELVNPERFGKVAVAPVVQFPHGLRLRYPVELGWTTEEPIFGD